MIKTFRNTETERLFQTGKSKRFQVCERVAARTLRLLDNATNLKDLGTLPGRRLESLKGSRDGQYSVRVNDQYRVCFEWVRCL